MNLENIIVKADESYPELVGATKDPMTVGILKNLSTSRVGELKMILQYFYNSVVADKTNKEIARIFEEIAVVEMIHLDLLQHAQIEFGGDGKYEDVQGNMFNVSLMNYSTRLKDILDYNIAGEQKTIESYQNAMNRVKNHSLKDLFARIIEDEKLHIDALETIKNNVEFLSI